MQHRHSLCVHSARLVEPAEQPESKSTPLLDHGLVPVLGGALVQPQQELAERHRRHRRVGHQGRQEQLLQLAVARAARVLDRLRGRCRSRVEATAHVLDPARGTPELDQPGVVAGLLEQRSRLGDERLELLGRSLRIGLGQEPQMPDPRVELAEPVAGGRGTLRGSRSTSRRLGRISRQHQRGRELQLEHDVERVRRE